MYKITMITAVSYFMICVHKLVMMKVSVLQSFIKKKETHTHTQHTTEYQKHTHRLYSHRI